MKALTIHQPWASLECRGLKGTETRGWSTSYRGPLLIHAGLRWDRYLQERQRELHGYLTRCGGIGLPGELPRGVALAICELVDCLEVTEANQGMFADFERIAGDLSIGRWVWVLERVRPFREPIPCRGAQGLWTVPPEIVEQVLRQVQISAALDTSARRRDLARDAKLEADRGHKDAK
jgi:activating signal cointegrator 1